MPFENAAQAEDFIFSSYMRVVGELHGPDAQTRLPHLTRQLLDRLDRPDASFTSLLVTGSKGKGSIALLTARLLQAMGYRVGLVTSPHIVHFRERVRVDGRAISSDDFTRLVNQLEVPAQEIMAGLSGRQYLSPTGLIVGLASLYFAEQEVDFAVIEAGRGGRWDDVSVLDNPVTLLGPILLEHAAQLGPGVAEIAAHKVALLKPGGVALSVAQSPEVQAVIESYANAMGAGLVMVGRDLEAVAPRIEESFLKLDVVARYNRFEDLALPIPALYEAENLALALGALEVATDEQPLRVRQFEAIRETLRQIRWPGRMQTLATRPLTIIDCAVTGLSAASVVASLPLQARRPLVAIVGVPSDRDWPGVLAALVGHCDALILTQTANPRLQFPAEGVQVARLLFPPHVAIVQTPTVQAALARLDEMQPPPQTVLILGTQSVVGEVLREYGLETDQL